MELGIAVSPVNVTATDGEHSLVERAKRDRQAFALLYRRHCRAIAGYIRRRVGDPHTTEDLVADVFLSAMQALPRYRQRGLPLRAWLYRIASNRVNRWARRERRVLGRLNGEYPDPRSESNEREARHAARRALLMLPPKYQTVLALHYLEGLSLGQVTQATGLRLGTVKSLLSRGREKLRAGLQRGGDEP